MICYADTEGGGSAGAEYAERGATLGLLPDRKPLPRTVKDLLVLAATTSGPLVMIVACDADGAIGRPARALQRELKSASPDALVSVRFCLALLGGARCSNSAASMADEIFGTGRRLRKALLQAGATAAAIETFEVQCELEDTSRFDVWLAAAATATAPATPLPPRPPQRRVVSLLSAATEMLYAMGLEAALVGRSHECDWPQEAVAALPALSAAAFDADAPAGEIDRQVGKE